MRTIKGITGSVIACFLAYLAVDLIAYGSHIDLVKVCGGSLMLGVVFGWLSATIEREGDAKPLALIGASVACVVGAISALIACFMILGLFASDGLTSTVVQVLSLGGFAAVGSTGYLIGAGRRVTSPLSESDCLSTSSVE